MDFIDFSDFRGYVYRAHGQHSGSSTMPLAEVIHKIRQKIKNIKKSEIFHLKILFIEKNVLWPTFFGLCFLTYTKSNLCEWHRATPLAPPVSAVNVPRKSEKSRKIMKNLPAWPQRIDFPRICRLKKTIAI